MTSTLEDPETPEDQSPQAQVMRLNAQIAELRQLGRFDDAATLAEEVCRIIRDAGGAGSPVDAHARGSLGSLLRAAHRYREAVDPLTDYAEFLRRAADDGASDARPLLIDALSNLGDVHAKLGEFVDAARAFDAAISAARKALGEHDPVFARAVNNRAGLYEQTGNIALARDLYGQAQEVWVAALGEQSIENGVVSDNLGAVAFRSGRLAEAEALHLDARKILEGLGTTRARRELPTTLNNLATVNLVRGHLETAQANADEGLALLREQSRGDDVLASTLLNCLGLVHLGMDQPEQARGYLEEGLRIRTDAVGDADPDVATARRNIALVDLVEGNPSDALRRLQDASAVADRVLDAVFITSSDAGRLAFLDSMAFTLDTLLSVVGAHFADNSSVVRDAFEEVARRKGLAAEALAIQRRAANLGERGRTWSELAELRKQVEAGQLAVQTDSSAQRISMWTARIEQLEAELAARSPELQLSRRLHEVSAQAISEALPEDAALVEMIRFRAIDVTTQAWVVAAAPDHRYAAFVLVAGNPWPRLVDLGDATTIDLMVARFRFSITGRTEDDPDRSALPEEGSAGEDTPESARDGIDLTDDVRAAVREQLRDAGGDEPQVDATDERIGQELREKLFDPIVAAAGGVARLIIAPDSELYLLPFDALPLDAGRYVIDEMRIGYVPVGRDVLREKVAQSPDDGDTGLPLGPAFVISDPDYDLDDGTPHENIVPVFHRLEGIAEEGKNIAAKLGVTPVTGRSALAASLEAVLSPRILHIATHGYSLEFTAPAGAVSPVRAGLIGLKRIRALENPLLRSGLALAGANTWLSGLPIPPEAGHGIVTAQDLASLALTRTELVVLSACRTGLGAIHAGEGVFGLRRAFAVAGAQTLVTSLWSVPDKATAELMNSFYDRVLAGADYAEALHDARLELRALYNPRVWAAFICEEISTRAEPARRDRVTITASDAGVDGTAGDHEPSEGV